MECLQSILSQSIKLPCVVVGEELQTEANALEIQMAIAFDFCGNNIKTIL